MSSRVPPAEQFGRQTAARERSDRDAADALRIDGSQFVRLYEKMQALVSGLSDTVTSLVNSLVPSLTYTRAEIDAKVASPGAISPTSVTSSGDIHAGGQLRAPDAVGFNITGTRRTVWIEDATGRFGYAPSTREAKTSIALADIDPAAVLSVSPYVFEYVAQVEERARRAALPSPYVDWNPDYPVALEVGFMAEDLDAAGLGFCVIYSPTGEPQGIEYGLFVVALQAALRWLAEENRTLRADLTAVTARLDAAGIPPEGA